MKTNNNSSLRKESYFHSREIKIQVKRPNRVKTIPKKLKRVEMTIVFFLRSIPIALSV